MRLPATSTATAFAEGFSCSFLCDFIRGHAVTHSRTFHLKTSSPPAGPLFLDPPLAPASRGNPPVRQRLSLPVVKRPLRIGARLARRLPKIHFEGPCWTGILNYNIVEVILLRNLLFTPLQRAAEAHERKSTKALCCQIIHNTADAISSLLLLFIFFFLFPVEQCSLLDAFTTGTDPCWCSGSRAGDLAIMCMWLDIWDGSHESVLAWPRPLTAHSPFSKSKNGPRASAEAQPAPSVCWEDHFTNVNGYNNKIPLWKCDGSIL